MLYRNKCDIIYPHNATRSRRRGRDLAVARGAPHGRLPEYPLHDVRSAGQDGLPSLPAVHGTRNDVQHTAVDPHHEVLVRRADLGEQLVRERAPRRRAERQLKHGLGAVRHDVGGPRLGVPVPARAVPLDGPRGAESRPGPPLGRREDVPLECLRQAVGGRRRLDDRAARGVGRPALRVGVEAHERLVQAARPEGQVGAARALAAVSAVPPALGRVVPPLGVAPAVPYPLPVLDVAPSLVDGAVARVEAEEAEGPDGRAVGTDVPLGRVAPVRRGGVAGGRAAVAEVVHALDRVVGGPGVARTVAEVVGLLDAAARQALDGAEAGGTPPRCGRWLRFRIKHDDGLGGGGLGGGGLRGGELSCGCLRRGELGRGGRLVRCSDELGGGRGGRLLARGPGGRRRRGHHHLVRPVEVSDGVHPRPPAVPLRLGHVPKQAALQTRCVLDQPPDHPVPSGVQLDELGLPPVRRARDRHGRYAVDAHLEDVVGRVHGRPRGVAQDAPVGTHDDRHGHVCAPGRREYVRRVRGVRVRAGERLRVRRE
mmetsp:Transcript_11536/g.27047  ORF Transcript_11536/g.27047 Transcript_11536/m.27047 type:complete len:539 (-) Transcript_11536:30-1646(-)